VLGGDDKRETLCFVSSVDTHFCGHHHVHCALPVCEARCACQGYIEKGKAVPLQAWSCPEGSRKLRLPDFMTTAQDGGKVVSLTYRLHVKDICDRIILKGIILHGRI
jgi:hypothetical protein